MDNYILYRYSYKICTTEIIVCMTMMMRCVWAFWWSALDTKPRTISDDVPHVCSFILQSMVSCRSIMAGGVSGGVSHSELKLSQFKLWGYAEYAQCERSAAWTSSWVRDYQRLSTLNFWGCAFPFATAWFFFLLLLCRLYCWRRRSSNSKSCLSWTSCPRSRSWTKCYSVKSDCWMAALRRSLRGKSLFIVTGWLYCSLFENNVMQ